MRLKTQVFLKLVFYGAGFAVLAFGLGWKGFGNIAGNQWMLSVFGACAVVSILTFCASIVDRPGDDAFDRFVLSLTPALAVFSVGFVFPTMVQSYGDAESIKLARRCMRLIVWPVAALAVVVAIRGLWLVNRAQSDS